MSLPVELVNKGTAPLVAAFGEAEARRDWRWIKSAYKNGTFASVILGTPFAAALGLAAKPLILIWAGPSAVPDSHLILWLVIYVAACVSLVMVGQLLCGIERVEPLVLCNLLCALGCVGFRVCLCALVGFERGCICDGA